MRIAKSLMQMLPEAKEIKPKDDKCVDVLSVN